ncbi:MAG TPA: MATE family efflux transporter [Candidatus Dormibacteraeota bacterium]|nr:MATE family efflux transporter [Candidatus Dormibacteraeota bacterium]
MSEHQPAAALLALRPLRAIVTLAAPTTAVMLIAALSNILHTYFVSRLGDDAIAAVSLVFPIVMILITVVSGGLGTGVASGIARALGAGRAGDARAIAEHAILITTGLAIGGSLASEIGARGLFSLMGGTGAVLDQATLFSRVLFGGLLISFTVGTFDSILRGAGNVRVPAMCSTLSLLLQIAFTPLFMFYFKLGLIGAPLATLTGQAIGLVPRSRFIFGARSPVRPRLIPRQLHPRHFGEILRVGVPASLSAALNYLTLMVLTGTVARFGDTYLAAYGLGSRLDFLLFSLGFGVAAAGLTLVGMAVGAGRPELVRRYVIESAFVAVAVVAIPAVVVTLRPSWWIGCFTDAAPIHAIGADYFHIVGPTYFFIVVSMVVASSFQALARAVVPLVVMVARVALVLAAALLAINVFHGRAQAIFAIIAIANVTSCLILILLFRRVLGARVAA